MYPGIQITLLLLVLSDLCSAIDVRLDRRQTCYDYQVEAASLKKIFYFHFNHNIDEISMTMYKKGERRAIGQSGEGIDYKNNMEIVHPSQGEYSVCFLKKSEYVADVSFDIINEIEPSPYAGKEEITKTVKRAGEFLMEIKQVGWTFRNVLEQHNKRKEKIREQQNSQGWLVMLKVLVMAGIVGLQVLAVKTIFK